MSSAAARFDWFVIVSDFTPGAGVITCVDSRIPEPTSTVVPAVRPWRVTCRLVLTSVGPTTVTLNCAAQSVESAGSSRWPTTFGTVTLVTGGGGDAAFVSEIATSRPRSEFPAPV
jgi:hypothetical protein